MGEDDTPVIGQGPPPHFDQQVRWGAGGNRYRLIKTAHLGVPIPLPGESQCLDLGQILEKPAAMVFSEQSGGSRGFFSWLWNQLKEKGDYLSVFIDGHTWEPDFFKLLVDGSEVKFTGDGKSSESLVETIPGCQDLREALQILGSPVRDKKGKNRGVQLLRWIRNNVATASTAPKEARIQRLVLIVRDLMSVDESQGHQAAQSLRGIVDHEAPTLYVLLLSHSSSLLRADPQNSPLANVAAQYQLPSLDRKELRLLAENTTSQEQDSLALELVDTEVDQLLDYTGGQPFLVQQVLHHLRQQLLTSSQAAGDFVEVGAENLIKAYRQLTDSPPIVAARWAENLRKMLKENPSLIERFRGYVRQESLSELDFPPPTEDLRLFISGWLGRTTTGRWGIRSDFHAHLARSVLDKLGECR